MIVTLIVTPITYGSNQLFGESLCQNKGFHCLTVKRHDSWHSLFKSDRDRLIVKKVNRYSDFLRPGMVIAVPDNMSSDADLSPMPLSIPSPNEQMVIISKKYQAWAAYTSEGKQVRWGPVSLGKEKCSGNEDCSTPSGMYRANYKSGKNCYSKSYPKLIDGTGGGAAMPYCIQFYKGYFIHAGAPLPGYASTHGCVNLFWNDAKWLNEVFIQTKTKKLPGTLIQIL